MPNKHKHQWEVYAQGSIQEPAPTPAIAEVKGSAIGSTYSSVPFIVKPFLLKFLKVCKCGASKPVRAIRT